MMMLERRDTGLIGTKVSLPDSCPPCRNYVAARMAKAPANNQGCRFCFACCCCGVFRGYVSWDLEAYIVAPYCSAGLSSQNGRFHSEGVSPKQNLFRIRRDCSMPNKSAYTGNAKSTAANRKCAFTSSPMQAFMSTAAVATVLCWRSTMAQWRERESARSNEFNQTCSNCGTKIQE